MLNIALEPDGEATSIKDISRREGISVAYLEQLLNKLRHDGLIESIRGPKGGYILSKGASEITVADVVRTLEGGIYPIRCMDAQKNGHSICKKNKGCAPGIVWHKLAKAINDCLESVTLKDLCAESKKIDRHS